LLGSILNAGAERDVGNTLVHLVDDDAAVRETLRRLLVSGGYTVKEYASGAEFLDAAEALDDGYVLLDINMPEPDGFAVKKALSDRSIDVPVIMMTGSGDLAILAMRAGVADFLQKPFGRGELLTALDQITAPALPNV
jgi:two-component system response regulator FixJ